MKKLLLNIKNLWNKLTGNLLEFLKTKAEVAKKIVDLVKQVVDNPSLDVLASMTESNFDNNILDKARKALAIAAEKLQTTDIILKAGSSNHEIINALVEYIRKQNKNVRAAFYISLAGLINEYLADGKIDFTEGTTLAGIIYKELN